MDQVIHLTNLLIDFVLYDKIQKDPSLILHKIKKSHDNPGKHLAQILEAHYNKEKDLINDDIQNRTLSLDERKHAYIRYDKVLRFLKNKYKEKHPNFPTNHDVDDFHRARNLGNHELCLKMYDMTSQDPVLNPKPMEVTVPTTNEFKDCFEFVSKNVPVINSDTIQFHRGAVYSDGRIDMCKQVVGSKWISLMCESIRTNHQLKHFLLGNNIVGPEGIEPIVALMNEYEKYPIETWYLAGNCIDRESADKIFDAMKNNNVATGLWLKRNPIRNCLYVPYMLRLNKTLKVLDMSNTGYTDHIDDLFEQGLMFNKTLEIIYLDSNGITAKQCKTIANYFTSKGLKDERGIQTLFICMNPLRDEGVSLIAKSLLNYRYLKGLHLGSTRMTSVGLQELLNGISKSSSELEVLNIGLYKSTADMGELPNCFLQEGASILAHFIRNNDFMKFLKVIDFTTSHIPLEGLEQLADAFDQRIQTDPNIPLVKIFYPQIGGKGDKFSKVYKRFDNIVQNHKADVRQLIHSPLIVNIDSIYRNNM